MAKELNKLETKFDEGMERKQIAQIKSFKSCEESNNFAELENAKSVNKRESVLQENLIKWT